MSQAPETMSPQLLLHHPLPADAITGMTWGPFRYRRYRVFSLPWLKSRFLVSAIAVSLYGSLIVLGQLVGGATPANAGITAAYFIVGAQLMLTIGPALATWVRYRRLENRREGWAVVAAVVLGVAAGMCADAWASRGIMNTLKTKDVPPSERKIGDWDKSLIVLSNLAFGFGYFACGGGLAALAYFSERRRLGARRAHMERLETDMKLAVLQAQIEPHFLFNTLASIRPLIRQDAGRAEAAIDALAAHLRDTIPGCGRTPARRPPRSGSKWISAQVISPSCMSAWMLACDPRSSFQINGAPWSSRRSCFSPWWKMRSNTGSSQNPVRGGFGFKPRPRKPRCKSA
jgi:hypothetical protein